MSVRIKNAPITWVAELAQVREVSLRGTADLEYWRDRLLSEGLRPVEHDGQAQLMIIAADLRYMGVRFREMSFSVLVSRPREPTRQDAAFLIGAFNSNRLFAFGERVLFSTPYFHGDARTSASFPPSVQLIQNAEVVFGVEMLPSAASARREASRSGEDGWEGPVFLPARRREKSRQGDFFVARLTGHTETYPFLPAQDVVKIQSSSGNEILEALSKSHFAVREWVVRANAAHSKSKTYRRAELLAGEADADALELRRE